MYGRLVPWWWTGGLPWGTRKGDLYFRVLYRWLIRWTYLRSRFICQASYQFRLARFLFASHYVSAPFDRILNLILGLMHCFSFFIRTCGENAFWCNDEEAKFHYYYVASTCLLVTDICKFLPTLSLTLQI